MADLVPLTPDRAAARALSPIARALRRMRLRVLARAARRDPAAVLRELAALRPELAAAVRGSQLYAYLTGARSTALALDEAPPAKPPTVPPAALLPPDGPDPGVRLPGIAKAAEYLHTRLDFAPAEFAALDADARRVGFTVAGQATDEAVRRVREALREGVAEGRTLGGFREAVADALESSPLSEAQVEAVYRTDVGKAYSAGQIAVLEHPLVAGEFPYLMWSATHDSRVRADHLAMETAGLDGTAVYRADDPVWDWAYPPAGWNCRCVVIPLSVEDAAARGVREAQRWLRTGRPPEVPQVVGRVPLVLPKGWVPTGRRLSPVA